MKRDAKLNILNGGRIIFGLLTIVAIGKQLSIQINTHGSIVNFFSYFTNLSNIFAAVMLVLGAVYYFRGKTFSLALQITRATSVICMAIVGIVFSVLLSGAELGHLLPWINFVLHYLMPVIIVLDWLLQPPQIHLSFKRVTYGFIFPICYLIYSLIRGPIAHFYAYPFLNPNKSGGYFGVALYCIAILVVFIIIGRLAVWSADKLKKESK